MSADEDIIRPLIIILAVVILAPVLMMIVWWPMMGMGGGVRMRDGMGATWMLPLLWLFVVGIIVGGGYLPYRSFTRPAEDKTDAALDELRLTYARGEITDEEFEKRRERLEREE